ncbi:MAG: glycerol kinase GlpK [Alphaproteobacteria bacterium]|nr:glycerol kinase GlpK [Alphaproteobacteria bacterium]
MTKPAFLLAIDQGTTSTRALLFRPDGAIAGANQQDLPQIFPADGWVEHDPEEIWRTTLATCRGALAAAGIEAAQLAAIGIVNQRETVVLWDRSDGRPVHNAIVWQDRRTAPLCNRLVVDGHEAEIRRKTGLVIDPYFSASKLAWLLDHVDGARAAAERGALAFGTVDSFLMWRLTNGQAHVTDATNASRTMLFDIHEQRWDPDLLTLFAIPPSVLPEVVDCAGTFGTAAAEHLGAAVPICGIAGDQQAALVGQVCFAPGMIKSTYGTGCFVLMNTGGEALSSDHRLLTTVAYRLAGETTYALEGSIFVAGAAVQWLRDGLGVIDRADQVEDLVRAIPDAAGVYMVPAFTGLGAPYWDAEARGAIFGLTRDSGIAHIARAALNAVCYQTRDLLEAMAADGASPAEIRVDGGMTVNDWLMQRLADLIGLPVARPRITETTAAGAAALAGLGVGLFASLDEISNFWQQDRTFSPVLPAAERDRLYAGWQDAVHRVLHNPPE